MINTILKNNLLKIFTIITITIFFVNSIVTISVSGDDDIRIVKIGYSTNYGIIKTDSPVGSEGYGFEYLNKIVQYTDHNYALEFIEVDWSVGMQMLSSGELDILAPANYSPERAEEYIFSKNVFANDTVFISSIDELNFIGFDGLNGGTIAVQENYTAIGELNSFLSKNNINANVIEVNIVSFIERMEGYDYDYLLASSLQLDGQLNVVAKLSSSPTYLMANINNTDIIADFDNAIERIEAQEYLYKERLNLKYFDYNMDDSTFITQEEYDLINATPIYRVGYSPDYAPLTYLNSSGELVGVGVEVMDMITLDSGVEFEFVDISRMEENFEVDISLLAPNFANEYFKSKQSIPYTYYPFFLVEDIDSSNVNNNIGVLNFYELPNSVLNSYTKGGEVVVYPNYDTMAEAFANNEIDRIILTSLLYNKSRTSLNDGDYIISPLSEKLSVLMGYDPDFPQEKVDIFNKFIARLDTDIVSYSLNDHTSLMQVSTISDVIKENPIIINAFLLLFGLMMLVIMIFVLWQKNKLTRMLNYDKVTGLYSQHKFINTTRKLINGDKQYTIISLDIDNFKHINEIYGYGMGSKVLKQLGYFLKHMMKSEDTIVSRGTGDGFLVLIKSENAVKKINEGLKSTNVVLKGLNRVLEDEYNFSFSLGYYHIKDTSLDLSFIIDCANLARNVGKKIVGTTVNEYTDEMNNERIAINEVVATMNKGLENREFIVHYQPKFDLNTMELVGAEALVRWNKNIQMISPDHFIPIFEKNGFIEKLDYYIIENVCDFIRKHHDVDLPLISLNLSGITIMRENLVDRIVSIIDRYGISSSQLELEITESAFIDNFELGVDKLIKLRELGFQISMDDFGAGISSLNRLKEMPIDVLKIDREFIVDSLVNEKGNKIIKNIVNMAKDLNLETIAEGIETAEQLDFLKGLGCDLGQGYFYSKPLPPYDFIKKVKSGKKQ